MGNLNFWVLLLSFNITIILYIQTKQDGVDLPLYLYSDRRQLVNSLALTARPATAFYERGVALIANSAL